QGDSSEHQRVALPMTDGIAGVGLPLVLEMLASVSVNPHNVRAVLCENPHLLWPNDELIRVGHVENSRESHWNAAVRYDVGKLIVVPQFQVLPINSFPFGVIRRMFTNADRSRSALSGLCGAIKDRSSLHLPHTAPIWKLLVWKQGSALATLSQAE